MIHNAKELELDINPGYPTVSWDKHPFWKAIHNGKQYHIIPLNDLCNHQLSLNCPCLPYLYFSQRYQSTFISHSAFDERETFKP